MISNPQIGKYPARWEFMILDALQKFVSLGQGEPMDVIQKTRPVIEGYCRTLYPT